MHVQVRCAALHALGNSAFDASNRRRYLQSPGLMQLLVMFAAAPDTPAPKQAPSPARSSPAARPAPGYVHQRQEAEAEGAGSLGEAIPVEDSTRPAATPLRTISQPSGAAGADSNGASGPLPVAPNPTSSPRTAADGQQPAAAAPSASPPSLTMTRAPSATGNTLLEAGTSPPAASAKGEGGRSSTAGQDNGGGTPGLSPPKKALAAAAGAAAAAAAAGEAAASASPERASGADDAGVTVGAVAGSAKPAPAGGACPSVAAAAEAILPKRRLVSVNNPVKLQAIRLMGILGEAAAVLLLTAAVPCGDADVWGSLGQGGQIASCT